MSARHIFFDLDGTLTDSRPGITNCIAHAMEALGRPAPPPQQLNWCIGPPLLESLTRLLEDEDLAQRALQLYRERFAAKGLYENALYPGVSQLLTELRRRGRDLYVATSKPQVFADQIVSHFQLEPLLNQVFGAELDGRRGDKSELLAHALRQTGAPPQDSVMVGDRRHDVAGARANKLQMVGVLYGYGSRHELIDAGASRLAESPEELLTLLA